MLEDATRVRATVWSFARQWLRVGNLEGVDDPPLTFRSGAKLFGRRRPRRLGVWSTTTPAVKACRS